MTTADETLAALDFTPTGCEYVHCPRESVAILRFTCGCLDTRVCELHGGYWRQQLARELGCYCTKHKRGTRLTLEDK